MGMAVLFALVLFYPLRPQRCHTPVAPFYAIAAMRRLEACCSFQAALAVFRPHRCSAAHRRRHAAVHRAGGFQYDLSVMGGFWRSSSVR